MSERLVLVMAPETVPRVLRGWPEENREFDVVLDPSLRLDLVAYNTAAAWEVGWRPDLINEIDHCIDFNGTVLHNNRGIGSLWYMREYLAGNDPFCQLCPYDRSCAA